MSNLAGLNIALCQMRVVPGRPDINAMYMISEIASASERGVDIIVFPELATSGYLIGDRFEDISFVEDIKLINKEITKSVPDNIVAIFGTVVSVPGERGEDGRHRMNNAAVIAQNGKQIDYVVKTLQPHYRYFDDPKHFFSARQIAEEQAELYRRTGELGIENCSVHDLLKIYEIKTSRGILPLGVCICEDIWKNDYALNPASVLAEKGARLLIAISASPWGWQKNRKRHRVIKELIKETGVPIVYVNNTGCQNNGDNIINFDGASTIYDNNGDIVYELEPYFSGTRDIILGADPEPFLTESQNDTEELCLGIENAVREMLQLLPYDNRRVIMGLSGGIDSATMAALIVTILGSGRVHLYNMPYEDYNDTRSINFAKNIARSLGCKLETRPITEVVNAILRETGIDKGTLAHKNIQARCRMEILAAEAQKLGGVFTCNGNKVEMAFGYGTLDGDMRGWLAPFADLVKREVRQLAEYINTNVYGKGVIPQECIDQPPIDGLDKKNSKDPFDYGFANRRGYHDEWVRAVTEFRWNPEKFLQMYCDGKLESELMLEPGTLKRLFPTTKDFVEDLERCWNLFNQAFYKRVQAPPIIVVSRRAFGRDLEESMMSTHYTQKYLKLRATLNLN